jgi:hypothetical protein
MTPLLLAACLGFASPSAAVAPVAIALAPMRVAEIPLKAPAGWKREERERGTVLTPGDVAEGKLYAVTVTLVEGKAGTLASLLESAKTSAAVLGPFQPAVDARRSTSEGGWDYEFVLGTIATADRALVAHLMAIKKGDEGGTVIVLSDSVETMTAYADAFATMVRQMGAAPAPAPTAQGAGDLDYVVPDGWVRKDAAGLPLLVKEKAELWTKYRLSLLVLPGEPLAGSVRAQFDGCWKAYVAPSFTTKVAPIPLMARLPSGHACAFDADAEAVDKGGSTVTVALFVLAHGGRAVPVLGIYTGPDWSIDRSAEADTARFLDTARIRGASAERVPLFDAASLAGEWSESSAEYASYVTRGGQYAGDASSATGAYFDLRADGSYTRTLVAVSTRGSVRERDAGAWTVDDGELVLDKGGRYSLLGYGKDPKAGRFLVIGTYPNVPTRLKFTNPRGILQATWLRAK